MYPYSEHRPDCRVFFKRLVTPDPEIIKQAETSMSHLDIVSKGIGGKGGAFRNYYPEKFRKNLTDKYREDYAIPTANLDESIAKSEKLIFDLNATIERLQKSSPTIANRQALTKAEEALAFETSTLSNTKISRSTVRAIYEPYLLELIIGLVSVNTSVQRDGVGTANINIRLPLGENHFVENILYGTLNSEMFGLKTNVSTPAEYAKNMAVKSSFGVISDRELSIFKLVRDDNGKVLYTDRRECVLLPNDMVQVYFSKRYSEAKTYMGIPQFPRDYALGFTGFIKNTSVSYSSGQTPSYSITINCEDVGTPLRVSRVNIDPAVDPRYRAEGLALAPFVTKLQAYGDEEATGPKIIESLIRGREGYWGGVSQIEIIDDKGMELDGATGQYVIYKKTEKGSLEARKTRVASMPWQFDRIPLNTFEDLIHSVWQPYVSAFKTSYRLWESDYKFRWDICREIAEIMEFEFYADNLGVLNYHPPFYNLNPCNIKYFIDDKDIISETHNFVDSGIVTAVEVISQSQLGIPQNTVKMLSAFASADDEWIQRYGMRFRSKNIPVLAGNDKALQFGDQQKLHETRYLYARAWLNRRNAEIYSAIVEIPGTPEYYLCNVVAFPGSVDTFIAELAAGSVEAISGNTMAGISKDINTNTKAKELINTFKVYYISGISHKYTHGGSFTTSLRLTHGRLWSKHFNVGYSFSEAENDQLLKNMNELYLNRTKDDTETLIDETKKAVLRTKLDLDIMNMVVKNKVPPLESVDIVIPANISTSHNQPYSVYENRGTVKGITP